MFGLRKILNHSCSSSSNPKHKNKLKRSTKGGPRLQRLNAQKDIDYTPPEIDKSSFRINGTEGELYSIIHSLGLSGPDDLGISLGDWEARKIHLRCLSDASEAKSFSLACFGSSVSLNIDCSSQNDGISSNVDEDDGNHQHDHGIKRCLSDVSPFSVVKSLNLDCFGSRVSLNVDSSSQNDGISSNVDGDHQHDHGIKRCLSDVSPASEVKSLNLDCFGSRVSLNVDSSSQNDGISSNVDVDDGDHKDDEILRDHGIKSCLSDASPASEVKSLNLDCCGSRVSLNVDSSSQNVGISSNTDDGGDHKDDEIQHVHGIKMCLSDDSPASKVKSLDLDCCGSRVCPIVDSSCQIVGINNNVGDDDKDQDEIHHDHGIEGVKLPVLIRSADGMMSHSLPMNDNDNVDDDGGDNEVIGGGEGIKGVRPPLLISLTDTMKYSVAVNVLGSHGEIEQEFNENECVENSESCSFTTTNDDGDSSSTTTDNMSPTVRTRSIDGSTVRNEPPSYISPNGRVRRIVNSWTKGTLLGRGSYGSVHEGITDGGFFLAVKEVCLLDQGVQGKQSIYQLEQEISLLSKFEHENIVQYYGTYKDKSTLYIFLELASKGSLFNLYHQYKLGDAPVSAYTRQILLGLKYLHDRNVVHRDIKCANILVDTNGTVKLADFGLAKSINVNDVKSCKGTAFWMAPEVIRKRGYGLAADIWSLGCTVLEMLTSELPYHPLECMQAVYRIGNSIPPDVPNSISKVARDFINQCVQVDPSARPTAAQLLDHPFVKGRHLYSSELESPRTPCRQA